MDTPSTHTSPPAKNRQGCYGCTFIFCLLFLIGGAIPALLNLPGLQARFTGLETTALVSADLSCSWTDSNHDTITGYYYTYTFTISSGKVYQIKDTSCSSKPDAVNTYETIWYQPTIRRTFSLPMPGRLTYSSS
jgi:hypothetical protein